MKEILDKNLLILASAGSGKTYQLGNRVIGMVGAKGVDPERIVALTFTRKAAGEFADSVLSKLGEAARDAGKAEALQKAIGGKLEVVETLEKVVRALPRFQLGTMDGFFARVVRGFQYELGLTGGKFELVQGPKLDAALSDILADILGNALEGGEAEEFLHAFKRATVGREERGVSDPLGRFFKAWHGRWKSGLAVSPERLHAAFGELPEVGRWEEEKRRFATSLRKAASTIEWTRKGQDQAYQKLVDALEMHTVGSGSLGTAGKLFDGVCEWLAAGGPLVLKHYKEFTPGPAAEDAFRGMLELLAGCELAAAIERTAAVLDLVARYDRECERRLRRRGMLGFDDVKVLMGKWVSSEEERLRREAVDFRLDARYDHWLLDEFQDTSRAEWRGMEPLLDEAASDAEGSLFVVGDVKQAIYGWRGGDVTLFDEVKRRYAGGLTVKSMPESWRSCPAVLALVNRVCGDRGTITDLFGEAVNGRWEWEEHVAARPKLTGESRVEVVAGKAENRYARMVELMKEIGVGERELSCGVLVRTNAQLAAVAELLRSEGFDVIEEGARKPTVDHPVGVALFQLVAWLADPADDFARGVVAMSRLQEILLERFGEEPWKVWDGLMAEAAEQGFAGMLEGVIEPLWDGLSEFGRRRAGDVIGALAAFDAGGGVAAREALRWITELEIPQSPGTAAVQVMTVHKSKGLGFDVVILPEIEDRQVPDAGKFDVASGDGWVLQNPARWVRDQVPALREAEECWGEAQCYETMCVQYVALTRAKRGLYVLLPEPPKSRKDAEDFASPANWILRSVGADGDGVLWQEGDPGWMTSLGRRKEAEGEPAARLGEAVPQRGRSTPSGEKGGAAATTGSAGGRAFGIAVHEAFEAVGWVDEEEPVLSADEAGEAVAALLQVPAIRERLERRGREVALFCEQPVEAIVDGKWMSGVIDRLHVFEGGKRIELIDFKTDGAESPGILQERYVRQMRAYRQALAQIFPDAEIEVWLLSTKLAAWVEV
ncbi:UvrD-helicase domain-containing protein [Haloferula sp. A504]|uniref:UvrD-helicase domain-containing protein n=1 Tax=Haloferula sp. A504 TaxID=3373601 RepID=UPI0031BD08E2|nr:UvrD-helicase domain-containing protein [Verrucomicrobiaceae bacterium E54]